MFKKLPWQVQTRGLSDKSPKYLQARGLSINRRNNRCWVLRKYFQTYSRPSVGSIMNDVSPRIRRGCFQHPPNQAVSSQSIYLTIIFLNFDLHFCCTLFIFFQIQGNFFDQITKLHHLEHSSLTCSKPVMLTARRF